MNTEPKTPLALRLAGILEQNNQKWPYSAELKAAIELRRLHDRVAELERENEFLSKRCDEVEDAWDQCMAAYPKEQLAELERDRDKWKDAALSASEPEQPETMSPRELVKRIEAGEKWQVAEHPQGSGERMEVLRKLNECILSEHLGYRVGWQRNASEVMRRAAALLSADDKAGGDDEAVAYLKAETTLPKYRGWAVCEDDDPNGFPVYTRPQPQAEAVCVPDGWREALQFYADGNHFVHDEESWDTVSGEPTNFWCDEAETATVEDGTVAAMALRGTPLRDEDDAAAPKPQEPGA